MNPFLSTKSDDQKVNPARMPGALGWFDEIGFESEVSLDSVAKGAESIIGDVVSLFTENVAGVEPKNEQTEHKPIAPTGSIEFSKAQAKQAEDVKQKEVATNKRIFYQALKEEVAKVENARDRMIIEEEIADIGSHMSTEEKNEMLHYQSGYKDRSIYQMAELRKKIIEQRMKSEKEKKETSIAQTKPKATAMNAAFEGGAGSQGAGQANLSFQATG